MVFPPASKHASGSHTAKVKGMVKCSTSANTARALLSLLVTTGAFLLQVQKASCTDLLFLGDLTFRCWTPPAPLLLPPPFLARCPSRARRGEISALPVPEFTIAGSVCNNKRQERCSFIFDIVTRPGTLFCENTVLNIILKSAPGTHSTTLAWVRRGPGRCVYWQF
jgi:hypothetical protein